MIIIGKFGFIRQIEGQKGYDRLKMRLKAHDIELQDGELAI